MRDRVKWKAAARIALNGKYGTAIGAMFLIMAVQWAAGLAVEVLVLGGTFTLAFQDSSALYLGYMAAVMAVSYLVQFGLVYLMLPGYLRVMLQIARREPAKASDVFWAFRNRPARFAGIGIAILFLMAVLAAPAVLLLLGAAASGQFLFASLYLLCYSLLLTVLLLYVQLTFAMFYFLLVQNPDMGIWQALMESRRMMRGRRGRFFVLTLSFLGWTLVGAATFGIGFLWLGPYMTCTMLQFFLDVQEADAKTAE